MREAIEAVVADFQERPLPALTPREASLPGLPGKADAVIGMRRSGKSYFLFQQIQQLLERSVPRRRMLYVNLEDERLLPLKAQELGLIPESLYRRFPESRAETCWFFLDEVQNVPGWERFVRRLLDTENVRVVVTGSSAKLLSQEIATSLRGRSLPTELLPFSFRESLLHSGVAAPDRWPPAAQTRSRLERAMLDHIDVGGFPEVQSLSPDLRVRVLQDYVHVVVLRDVIERHQVTNPGAVRALVRQLLAAPAAPFSVHKAFNDLKSQGFRLGKDTVYEYFRYLEDAFLIFPVEIDSQSVRARMTHPRKCYLIDPGLARAFSYRAAGDLGWLLENVVYLELRRRAYQVNYAVTPLGREIDFVARRRGHPDQLIQVCADLGNAKTRERELGALTEALRERPGARGTVVSLHDEETVKLGRRTVRIVPAWRWLLTP